MPTYQYRCTQCGNELEVVQKFTDAALTECDECHGALRKVYNAVGVVFKGSGFYRTDSRAESKANGVGATSEEKSEKSDRGEKSDKGEKTDRGEKTGSAAPAASSSGEGSGGSSSGGSSTSTGASEKKKKTAASSTAA